MKSNKGFTLIELLAVIVILAIIALIATPIILGVIETARENSAKSSALGYIDALEKQIAIDMLAESASDKKLTGYTLGSTVSVPVTGLTVKGEAPTGGSIVTDDSGAAITGTCLTVGDYKVTYDGSKATVTKGSCSAS